ncbi:hypothetical protein Q1695_011113 [Nippostrongylus brasiliensis]|nr:hypothetical protein Q1695_011113 [Nippostrongylus brasiliensis]
MMQRLVVLCFACVVLVTASADSLNDLYDVQMPSEESTLFRNVRSGKPTFIRFGKRAQPSFIRFGRAQPSFIRFGRQSAADVSA